MENLFARTISTRVFGNFRKSFTFLGVLGALCLSINATPLWAVCTPNDITNAAEAAAAVTCSEQGDALSLSTGSLSVTTAIDLAGGDDIFTWTHSAFGAGGSISGGAGSDNLVLGGTLALDGALFTNFEVLTVGTGSTVTQTNTLDLGEDGAATFSAGTYTIADGADLQANTITVSGGALAVATGGTNTGSGTITMGDGDGTFTWSSGTVTVAVDAGAGEDKLVLSGGTSSTPLAVTDGLFTNFEVLEVSGSAVVTQTGTLVLVGSSSAMFLAGTYTIEDDADLQANTITVSGGTIAVATAGTGTDGTITMGDGDGTFTWSSGTVTVAVDAGAGSDTLALGGGTIALDGALFTNFEVLTVTGASTAVTQTNDLVLVGSGSATFSDAGGTYTIADDADLQVNTILVDGGTILVATTGTGTDGIITMGTGDVASSFTIISGSVAAAVTSADGDDTFTVSGGTVTGAVNAGAGANTFTVSAGTVSGDITLGAGDDTFTVSGTGTVSGDVTLGAGVDTVTVSGGTVSGAVATGAGADIFTVSGGTLSGAVTLGADGDTFTWSGGTVSGTVDAGAGTEDTLVLSGGLTTATALAVTGGDFTNFESLEVTGGIVSQSGALALVGSNPTVAISGDNTFYTVADSASLGTAANAVTVTLSGTSNLAIQGEVQGNISGDDAVQSIHVFASNPFGLTADGARTIDLGGGIDILLVDTDGPANTGTADVTFVGNTGLTFKNIEVLFLTGGANKFNWGGDLTISSAADHGDNEFHTLSLNVGDTIVSTQNVIFEGGSSIIINDIEDVAAVSGAKPISFSSDGTITLPGSGEQLGIVLHSASGAAFTVTLTLENVTLADAAAFEALKETLFVVDSTITILGSVEIADETDFSTAVDLTLTLELPAHFVSVTGGNARVSTLNSIFTAGDTPPALLAAAQTAASTASNPGLASVSFANSLVPEDYAHFSPLVARSQSLTVGRILDRLGSGSTAQSDDVTNTDSWTSRSKPWVSISTRSGELDTTDDESGYDNSIEMAVAGIDIALGGGGVFGAFAGRSELTQELNSKDRKDLGAGNPLKNFSKINYSTAFFGVYGERRLSNLRLSLLGSYATGNASVRGATEIGTTLQRRKADFDMDILSGQLRVSWDFEGRVFGMQVEPVLDAIWTKVDRSSVDETRTIGNATGIVRIGEDRYESLIASGGFNLTQQDDRKRIDISVGWRQEIKDGDPASRATVTGASSSAFDVDGRTPWSGAAYISASIGRAQQAFGSQGYIELFLDHENDFDEYEGFSLGVRIRSTF